MKPGSLVQYLDRSGKLWLGIILEENEHSDWRKVLWHDRKISSIVTPELTLLLP